MTNFKKGDIVVFTGKIEESFMEDLNVGQRYIIDSFYLGDEDKLTVKDMQGYKKCWMRAGNFELYKPDPEYKYEVGDRLIVVACDGRLGSHQFDLGTEIEVVNQITRRSDNLRYYECVDVDSYGDLRDTWYLNEDEVIAAIPEAEEAEEDENDYQLASGRFRLKNATFLSNYGERVTIKRSKCRHYYLESDSIKQKRITKAEAYCLLSEVVDAI